MKCPSCEGVLRTQVYHGVSLDKCSLCLGVLLPENQLEEFIQSVLLNQEFQKVETSTNEKTITLAEIIPYTRKFCLYCEKSMKRFNYDFGVDFW